MHSIRFAAPDLPLIVSGFVFAWLVVVVLEARAQGSRARRLARVVVRSAILLAIALAIAAPSLREDEVAPHRRVVLLDRAVRAIPGGAEAADALLARARATSAADGGALDVFDFDLEARRSDTGAPRPATRDAGPAPRSRVAPALAAAALAVREDESAVVILASDGRAESAGAADALRRLDERAIPVRAVAIPAAAPPARTRPSVEPLDVPDVVRNPFAVRTRVRDATPGSMATLVLDGKPIEASTRALAADGEVSFDDLVWAPGLHDVAIVVAAGESTGADAGPAVLARTLVRVASAPRALIVARGEIGALLRRTLSSQDFVASLVAPASAGEALVADGALDLVVLDSDATPSLPPSFMTALLERVRAGMGLWIAAGTSTEAWASLGQSVLAPVLPLVPLEPPVSPLPPDPPPASPPRPAPPNPDDKPDPGPGIVADPRPEQALPISLLLVIDRSGSMANEGKLGMAVRAAEEAASTLAPTDRVGVISFADEPTLDTPIAPVALATAVGVVPPLKADGDTDIYGALALAARTMAGETNPIRHVLLLTDGMQTGSAFFSDLVARMAEDRITVSTVGLGQAINEFVLKRIATLGRGRYAYAPTPNDLPRVLTRDTRTIVGERTERVARERLARMNDTDHPPPARPPGPDEPERSPPASPTPPPPSESRPPPPPPAPPTVPPAPLLRMRPHEALLGLDPRELPSIGMPRTSKAATPTSVILVRQTGEPVLAAGRAGLGRVIALALPVTDPGFVGWAGATRLVAQSARSVAAPSGAGPEAVVRVESDARGDRLRVAVPEGVDASEVAARIRVRRRDAGGIENATVVGTDGGEGSDVVYRLPPSTSDRAEVLVEARPEEGGEPVPLPPIAYLPSKGPPPRIGSDPTGLGAGLPGRVTPSDDASLFDVPTKRRSTDHPLAPWLAALAVLLLPVDVGLHRRGRAA